jgi:hypothetical protein
MRKEGITPKVVNLVVNRPKGLFCCGTINDNISPRQWLQGNTFIVGELTILVSRGGVGKTAMMILQAICQATGRPLLGEHIFKRRKVLYVNLEDNEDEMKRRVYAAMLHHKVTAKELAGWMDVLCVEGLSIVNINQGTGDVSPEPLAHLVGKLCQENDYGLIIFDPLVHMHNFSEIKNEKIAEVAMILTSLARGCRAAVGLVHHARKSNVDEPGDADMARGASALINKARISRTLTAMSKEEAKSFRIPNENRWRHVRLDDAKLNLAPARATRWFTLEGVNLGNQSDDYPHGDNVQTVVAWEAPVLTGLLATEVAAEVLKELDKGPEDMVDKLRFSAEPKAEHLAWKVVKKHCADLTEKDAKNVISEWLASGVLLKARYHVGSQRKIRLGIYVRGGEVMPGVVEEPGEEGGIDRIPF